MEGWRLRRELGVREAEAGSLLGLGSELTSEVMLEAGETEREDSDPPP